MARETYVKRAQQRYETKPVLDPATGEPKRTPVMRADGTQRTSKRGPVFMTVTERDLTKPLPPLKCESCDAVIAVGMPYKHITPKSGPYGGRQRNRCADCPTWQVWDYSYSLSARLAQLQHEAELDLGSATTQDDIMAARDAAAEAIREMAREQQDKADNMEQGFGHATSQSEELADQASQLESWADDVEGTDVEDIDLECQDCAGSGKAEDEDMNEVDCPECDGKGELDEPTDDALDDARQAVRDALDNCPL